MSLTLGGRVRLARRALALGLAAGLVIASPGVAHADRPASDYVRATGHLLGPIRMEVVQIRAGTSWSTAYWRLSNSSSRPVWLPGTMLRSAATPRTGSASYASSGLALIAGPARTAYEPLTARYPIPDQERGPSGEPGAGPIGQHCLCTHLGDQQFGPGMEFEGFTTFPRLPGDVDRATVTAPRFGTFADVPVVRGQLPGARIDSSGFAVEGIDRLPYATVLRVRRNPIQPGRAFPRPDPLATAARAPQAAGEVVLIDPATLTSYTALYSDERCMCTSFAGGYPEIGIYVFPPLPTASRPLRVWYTGGLPVDDIPVGSAGAVPGGTAYAPWPSPRPAGREVAGYPRHDEVVFDAYAEREGMRRELRTGQATVFFDLGSASVGPRSRTALRRLAVELSARPEIRTVKITGNTDLLGSEGYNLELSGRRARAVAGLLDRWTTRPDVAFTIEALGELGAGDDHPTSAERALNRNATISPS
jgi:outer membrane protein OmpA-like peptidoglycan-associated protein